MTEATGRPELNTMPAIGDADPLQELRADFVAGTQADLILLYAEADIISAALHTILETVKNSSSSATATTAHVILTGINNQLQQSRDSLRI